MKTLFQSESITALEERAIKRIDEICNYYGGSPELKYAAKDAMIWLSSQPEIQGRNYRKRGKLNNE